MEILIKHYTNSSVSIEEIRNLKDNIEKYGNVHLQSEKRGKGAVDIIISVDAEVLIAYDIIKSLFKPMKEGFFKGFVGEDNYKNIGKSVAEGVADTIVNFKNFIKAYYDVFVVHKIQDKEADIISIPIENVTLIVVLNDNRITKDLVDNLAEALVKTYSLVILDYIDITPPFLVQLYPNFQTNSWDYLFAPTPDGYGNFVDRYYDFNDNQFHYFNSAIEFLEYFPIDDINEYKFIISAKYHLNRQTQ